MTRREKQCKRILSTSLLDAIVPSDPNRGLPIIRLAGSWLSRWPWTQMKKIEQVRQGDQT